MRAVNQKPISQGTVLLLMLCVLAPFGAFADPPEPDAISLVGELEPVGSEALEEARGMAAMPGGFGLEVTAVLRLLAEGQDVLTMTGAYGLTGGVSAPETVVHGHLDPLAAAAMTNPIIVNSLNGVSLEQYREITIHLTDFQLPSNRSGFPTRSIPLGGSGH